MEVDYDIDLDALLNTHGGDPVGTIPMIGYIRVSTAREDMISPEIQVDHIDRYARQNGRRIVQWVADLDMSGGDFKQRQIVGLIEQVENGTTPENAREIGVWKFSRFGRNRSLGAIYLGRLEKAGGHLISATEPIDATNSAGRFNRNVLMDLAEFERDRISEGWQDVQAHRLRRGLPGNGRPRWGYTRLGRIEIAPGEWRDDPNDPLGERYVVDEDNYATEHRRAYEEAAAGRSGYAIVRWLNTDQVPSPRGTVGRWSHTTLWPLLDSGFGCGYLRVHDPECTNHAPDKWGWCQNRTWIDGAHPHLWAHLPDGDDIRDRIWSAYRKRRSQSRSQAPPRTREARYELTAIVTCGWCDGPMSSAKFGSSGRRTWRCNGKTKGTCPRTNSASDAVLLGAVRDLLKQEHQALTQLAEEIVPHDVTAPDTTTQTRAEEIDARLDRLRNRLDRLTDQYADGDIPRDAYIRARDRALSERAEIEAEQAELAARPDPVDPIDYLPVIRDLREEWDTLPVWSRNAALKELLTITVYRLARSDGHAMIHTAWGAEKFVDIVEPKGMAMRYGHA